MAKKRDLSYKPLLMAACFTILAVGVYAHVDGYLVKKQYEPSVLGWESKKQTTLASILDKVWGRLRYGSSYDPSVADDKTRTEQGDQTLPVDALLERELKNIESEMKSDPGADTASSYWSM